jgi:hypothetical protein
MPATGQRDCGVEPGRTRSYHGNAHVCSSMTRWPAVSPSLHVLAGWTHTTAVHAVAQLRPVE